MRRVATAASEMRRVISLAIGVLATAAVASGCGSSGSASSVLTCQQQALSGPEPPIRTTLGVTVRSLGVDPYGNLRLEARSAIPMMTEEAQWRAWPGIATNLLRSRRLTYTLRFRKPDGCAVLVSGNTPAGGDVLSAADNLTLRAAPSPVAWSLTAGTVRRLLRSVGIHPGSVLLLHGREIGAYAFIEVNPATFGHLDGKMGRIARVLSPRRLPLGFMLINHSPTGAGEMNIGGLVFGN
jgi:hypothetical protein